MVPPNFIAYLDCIYPSNTPRDLHGKIYVIVNTLIRINMGFMKKHMQCTERALMGDKVKPCGYELIAKRKHLIIDILDAKNACDFLHVKHLYLMLAQNEAMLDKFKMPN